MIVSSLNNKSCLDFVKSLSKYNGVPFTLENISKVFRDFTQFISDSSNLLLGSFTASDGQNIDNTFSVNFELSSQLYINYYEKKIQNSHILANSYHLGWSNGAFNYSEIINFSEGVDPQDLPVTYSSLEEYYNNVYTGIIPKDFLDVYVSYYDGLEPFFYEKNVKNFVSDCFLINPVFNRKFLAFDIIGLFQYDINAEGSSAGSLNKADGYYPSRPEECYFFVQDCNDFQVFTVDVNFYANREVFFSVDELSTSANVAFNRTCSPFSINCNNCSEIEDNFLKLYSLISKVAVLQSQPNESEEQQEMDYTQVLTSINNSLQAIHSDLQTTVEVEEGQTAEINITQAVVNVSEEKDPLPIVISEGVTGLKAIPFDKINNL